jgi:hypothetical protein
VIVLVGFMSKGLMKIDSEGTFNDGFFGCTVVCATGSVMKVALTGYGYLYWNISTSETKQAPVKRLGLWWVKNPHAATKVVVGMREWLVAIFAKI